MYNYYTFKYNRNSFEWITQIISVFYWHTSMFSWYPLQILVSTTYFRCAHLEDDSNKGLFSICVILHCAVTSHLSPSKGVPVLFLSFLYLGNENNYLFFVMLLYTLIAMCKTQIARCIVIMWRPSSVWCICNILSFFLELVSHIFI